MMNDHEKWNPTGTNMNFDENLNDFGCGLDSEGSMTRNAAAFLKSYARTCTVFNAVSSTDQIDQKKDVLQKYLNFCYGLAEDGKIQSSRNPVKISLNERGIESITSGSLPDVQRDSFTTLYLVEFFTHCCINCIHSIEDVREVHVEINQKFKHELEHVNNGFKGLKVLSVHSPKFPREKNQASIAAFCKRNRMDHSEVINDPECALWNEFGVTCWPTILILGPNPDGRGHNLLFNFMGEGHRDDLLLALSTCMEYFMNKLKPVTETDCGNGGVTTPAETVVSLNNIDSVQTFLRFPGKVTAHREHIVISDSGNNRLVVATTNGKIVDIIGGSGKGCKDGDFQEAQFYNPQGVAFENDSIFYVADTGNHAIRKIDLSSKKVYTFINPGRKVEVNGESETLKSPWDLTFYSPDILLIAAAGNHRLFGYFFSTVTLFGVEHGEGTFSVVAGSGREENRNNSYLMKASFAQPSGISTIVDYNTGEKNVFIADSESSSIRSLTSKGQVVGIVGGSRDPTDLFAFGDVDGKGVNAKLQHPMGVCPGTTISSIFVVDTYNHKIKKIDVSTKECVTVINDGLNEPSDICKDPKDSILYVADTNNHSIKVFDVQKCSLSEMKLTDTINHVPKKLPVPGNVDKIFELPTAELTQSLKLNFVLSPLPNAFEGGQWKIIDGDTVLLESSHGILNNEIDPSKGHFSMLIKNVKCTPAEFYVNVDVFFCGPKSCLKRTLKIKTVILQEKGASNISDKILEWPDIQWDN